MLWRKWRKVQCTSRAALSLLFRAAKDTFQTDLCYKHIPVLSRRIRSRETEGSRKLSAFFGYLSVRPDSVALRPAPVWLNSTIEMGYWYVERRLNALRRRNFLLSAPTNCWAVSGASRAAPISLRDRIKAADRNLFSFPLLCFLLQKKAVTMDRRCHSYPPPRNK